LNRPTKPGLKEVLGAIAVFFAVCFVIWCILAIVNKAKADTWIYANLGPAYEKESHICGGQQDWIGHANVGIDHQWKTMKLGTVPVVLISGLNYSHLSCFGIAGNEEGYGREYTVDMIYLKALEVRFPL
jgi:hypothetical protein